MHTPSVPLAYLIRHPRILGDEFEVVFDKKTYLLFVVFLPPFLRIRIRLGVFERTLARRVVGGTVCKYDRHIPSSFRLCLFSLVTYMQRNIFIQPTFCPQGVLKILAVSVDSVLLVWRKNDARGSTNEQTHGVSKRTNRFPLPRYTFNTVRRLVDEQHYFQNFSIFV